VNSNPAPFSGSLDHRSAAAAGSHQHYFANATATLTIGTGDVLYAYVYLDPINPPSEVMLQWSDGTWAHRAYWGEDNLSYGIDDTVSRHYMGPLPPVGQWVQLKVPASEVGLEGSTLNGMGFTLYGGSATWDTAGRLSSVATANASTIPAALRLSPTGATLTWSSSPGHAYQVAYKDHLTDPSWTNAGQVTASGNSTVWTDPAVTSASGRFYMVTQMN